MLGEPTPNEADPTRTTYAFEKAVTKAVDCDGFAYVWKQGEDRTMNEAESYKRRLEELNQWLADARSPDLQARYEAAIDITNVAVETWVRLIAAAASEENSHGQYVDEQRQSISKQVDKLSTRAADLLARPYPAEEVNRNLWNIERSSIAIGMWTESARELTLEIQNQTRLKAVKAAPELADVLFTKIFAPDQTGFRFEAVIDGIEVAIGFIPVGGTVFDVIKRLFAHSQASRVRGRIADEHLTYLDQYRDALDSWCIAAEATINWLQANEAIYVS